MLTWSRLHESTFFVSIAHALWSNFVMLSSFAVLFASLVTGNMASGIISAVSLIVAGLMCAQSYALTRRCVLKSCQMRGESIERLSVRRFAEIFWMAAPAHFIFGISCAKSILQKRIQWRDITYEVRSHNDIKRLDYAPYVARNSEVSI